MSGWMNRWVDWGRIDGCTHGYKFRLMHGRLIKGERGFQHRNEYVVVTIA